MNNVHARMQRDKIIPDRCIHTIQTDLHALAVVGDFWSVKICACGDATDFC